MTNNDEDTSRQAESLWRSDDWADLRWAREHSTPQQIARHLLDRSGGTATTTRWTSSWR